MTKGATSAATLMAAAFISTQVEAFEIRSSIDTGGQVTIQLESLHDFEAGISLRLRTDPHRVDDERLAEVIEDIDLRDALGRLAGSGRAVDRQADIVLGFSGGSAEIVRAEQTPDGLQVIGLFRGADGQIVNPPVSSIAAASLTGQPRCFDATPITRDSTAPPMWFGLMLDRSGSMDGHMDEVIEAAATFLGVLPETAQCSVFSFSNTWTSHSQPDVSRPCQPENFDLSSLEAGGGTNIYAPLAALYGAFGTRHVADWQRAVIILTDGRVSDTPDEAARRRASLQALKGETLTFVYWLGDHDEQDLRELADSFISHRGEMRASLGQYFGVLGEAFTSQQVITIRACAPGEGHAAR